MFSQDKSNKLAAKIKWYFVLLMCVFLSLKITTYTLKSDELNKNELFSKAISEGISDQEYKDGMEQKKLLIKNPEKALKEKRWNPCASIGLGDGYSILMQFRQAHPLVAEYHRRVMVFGGTERQGKLLGALQLSMNFGGRTYILLYRHLDATGQVTHLTFDPRDQSRSGNGQTIRLIAPDFENAPKDSTKEYLGLISGEAYPLKFITPSIISEEMALKKMRRKKTK